MAAIEELLSSGKVLDGNKQEVSVADICKDKRAVCLYFSAHWCPPCRGFTPTLANFYKANKENCVIIFVSSDRDQDSFDEYFGEMPWYALPYSERELKEKLSEIYSIKGIPTLVVLKPDGTTIELNGRSSVQSAGTQFPSAWMKP